MNEFISKCHCEGDSPKQSQRFGLLRSARNDNFHIAFIIIALFLLACLIAPAKVFALRPFVTTDAYVVETNLVEIELGVFGLHTQRHPGADEITLDLPGIRFNYGLPWDSEIVLETVGELIDNEYKGELGRVD